MRVQRLLLGLSLAIAALVSGVTNAGADRIYLEGGYLVGGFPTGDWSKVAGAAMGLEGTNIVRLDASQLIAFRSTLGWAYNFSRTVDVSSSNLAPGDQLAIQTSNNTLYFGIGPELSKPSGPARGFVYATVGFNTNWTNGGLDGTVSGNRYSANVGATSTVFAWSVGGGLRKVMKGVPGGKIELSAEYRSGTGHNYLLPDDVRSSGGNVAWDRKGHVQDQVLVRLGTVYGR